MTNIGTNHMKELISIPRKTTRTTIRGHGEDNALFWCSHLSKCAFCRKKRGVSHLEFYSIDGFDTKSRGYRLRYPHRDAVVVALVSHPDCGPDIGYALRLDEIAEDPDHWYRHLSQKTWSPGWLKDGIWDVLLIHRKAAYSRFNPSKLGRAH